MSTERYHTVAGEVIEYPTPEPELAAFLARVIDAAHDPRVTEGELIELVYGRENPLLDQTIFPGRGAVTKAVLVDPVYHVMQDLLFAKRVQMGRVAEEETGAPPRGLSVAEVAEQLGISQSAVRQAIRRGDLEAEKVKGAHSIAPESVATYRGRVKRRGPQPEPALRIKMGNKPGRSFRVKVAGLEVLEKKKLPGGGKLIEAVVPRFERAAVAFSGKSMNRMFLLEPAEEENSFEFDGFEIRGRYRVAEKINQPEVAAELWKTISRDGTTLFAVEVADGRTLWVVARSEAIAADLARAEGFSVRSVLPGVRAPKPVRGVFSANSEERVMYPGGLDPKSYVLKAPV